MMKLFDFKDDAPTVLTAFVLTCIYGVAIMHLSLCKVAAIAFMTCAAMFLWVVFLRSRRVE